MRWDVRMYDAYMIHIPCLYCIIFFGRKQHSHNQCAIHVTLTRSFSEWLLKLSLGILCGLVYPSLLFYIQSLTSHNSPGTNYLCEKPKTPFLHVITVSCQIKWTKLIDTREPACGSRRNKGLVSRHPSRAQSETCRTIMPLQGNGRSCLKKASPIIKIYLVNYFYIRMFLYFKNIFFILN